MVNNRFKKYSLLFIKYTPAIMSIVCSLKIILLTIMSNNCGVESCEIVNWVNILLNIFIIVGVYFLGRTFGYCWKHRSLCRTAAWGIIFYALFISFDCSKEKVLPLAIFYLLLVLIMVVLYREIK